jgi:5-methyltetrahydropteroyltriglutamate--homocysteine methyltransferase
VKRSEDRILTTHVGSLVRPPELLEAAAAAKEKPQTQQAYLNAVRRATVDVVKRQVDAGVDVINDGEYGKSSWANYVLARLSGFEPRPDKLFEAVWLGRDRFRFHEFLQKEFPRGATGIPGHVCAGPIKYRGQDELRRNIADLKAALASSNATEGFFTAVAPASTGYDAENQFYKEECDYVFAIAEALREEYLEIVNAGLVLQVDDAVLANMYDELVQESPQRYRAWAELRVDALNHALRGIPEDRVRYHICFGRACAARLRRAAGSDRRSHAEGARRRLFDRSSQCPSRARVACVGEGETSYWKDPDPRCDHASHHDCRAPASGRRPARPVREHRRPREFDRWH